MDRVEEDVGELKTEVAKTTSSVDGMRGDLNLLFGKMDQVITSTSHLDAAKDHIPSKYVTWGIGLSLSSILTMVGIGVTVTTVVGAVVLWAMDAGDAQLEQTISGNERYAASQLSQVTDDVSENRRLALELADRGIETEKFTARLDERFNKIQDELLLYKNKDAHTLQQSEPLNALQKEVQQLRGIVERNNSKK